MYAVFFESLSNQSDFFQIIWKSYFVSLEMHPPQCKWLKSNTTSRAMCLVIVYIIFPYHILSLTYILRRRWRNWENVWSQNIAGIFTKYYTGSDGKQWQRSWLSSAYIPTLSKCLHVIPPPLSSLTFTW